MVVLHLVYSLPRTGGRKQRGQEKEKPLGSFDDFHPLHSAPSFSVRLGLPSLSLAFPHLTKKLHPCFLLSKQPSMPATPSTSTYTPSLLTTFPIRRSARACERCRRNKVRSSPSRVRAPLDAYSRLTPPLRPKRHAVMGWDLAGGVASRASSASSRASQVLLQE